MRRFLSKKRFFIPVLFLSTVLLVMSAVQTPETPRKSDDRTPQSVRDVPSDGGKAELRIAALGERLLNYRKAGDFANARRLFAILFPPDTNSDAGALGKIAYMLPANTVDRAADNPKEIPAGAVDRPVMNTGEHEKSPSIDMARGQAGGLEVFVAAEQWNGGLPRALKVKKSSDNGATWSAPAVIGDASPWTRPIIRQISADEMGIIFVKNWSDTDHDIFFARVPTDLASSTVVPVEYSSAMQDRPSMVSDYPVFSSPYTYVAYSEHTGTTTRIKFRISQDLGATWSLPKTVAVFSSPRDIDCKTTIAVDPVTSYVYVAYVGWQGRSEGIAVSRSLNFGANWSMPTFVTSSDAQADSSPVITARNKTVVVAYEHIISAATRDIGYAYSTENGSAWTTGGQLSSGDVRSPDVRASDMPGPGRIYVSYVRDGNQVMVRDSATSKPARWTPERNVKNDSNIVDGDPGVLLPKLDTAGNVSVGVAWSEKNPDADIFYAADAIVYAPGPLTVTPAGGLTSTGIVGGPFTPASIDYTLTNTGDTALDWTATKAQSWVTLSSAGGTLDPLATTTVTVSINSGANALAAGSYNDTVSITNTTNGSGNTTRSVSLTVNPPPGAMAVTPAGAFTSTGNVGGPFTPASIVYTVQNTGGVAINWTAAATQAWVTVAPLGGSLGPAGSTTVTVSINANANALAAGVYADTVTFTNTTNGTGNTTRGVSLTVSATAGALSVTPAGPLTSAGTAGGPFTPASIVYTLQNTGGTAIAWTATKVAAWVTLSAASGNLAAGATTTVTVSINANANTLVAGSYSDTETFTNTTNGTGNTTRAVALTVNPTAGAMTVTPAGALTSTGVVGGPFTPASIVYTLTNTGGVAIDWTAAKGQGWVTLSAASGTLAPAGTTTVTVSINAAANALSAGNYTDTVSFTNATNGSGNTTRAVSLTVTSAPGAMTVTPAGGLTSTGAAGGPFSPTNIVYTLQNTGGVAINWTATKTAVWVTLSAAAGTLNPGGTTTVTVSIDSDANALAAGSYTDTVTFTNTTNGSGNTTRPVNLTVGAAPGVMSVTPTGALTSTGTVGGPFSPVSTVYTIQNTGGTTINWTAAKTAAWVTLSAASGALAPAASVAVTVSINATANTLTAGTYTDTVTFTNTTNGSGNTTRPVNLTVGALPGTLTVTPAGALTSTGNVGGPFSPASIVYTIRNTGGTAINWTAAKYQTWLTLSVGSGTLDPAETDTVTVTINATANSLGAGNYTDNVYFTNVTNGNGSTTRSVSLTINPASGAMSVTTADGLISTGPVGGPFVPASITYTIQNTGGISINWTATKTQPWVTLSSAGGTLTPGASTPILVSINTSANSLVVGTFSDTVTFTNTTNGSGNTTRPISLTVTASPHLSVTPTNRDVSYADGVTTFGVSNTATGTMNWNASITTGSDWMSISAGSIGTNSGTVQITYVGNHTTLPRQGVIRITAAGATGSPVDVTVTQASGSFTLQINGQRLVEKAWIIQREYGRVVALVDNPASITVSAYVLYRKSGTDAYQEVQRITGSAVLNGQGIFNDTFLTTGVSYTYKVVALDALGAALRESNEITI